MKDISLKDHFASTALHGLLAGGWVTSKHKPNTDDWYEYYAKQSYMLAKAMMKEKLGLEKNNG